MKTPLTLLLAVLLLGGCLTPPPRKVISDAVPYLSAVTQAIATATLQLAIDDPDSRKEISDQMYAVAMGVRSLMGGVAPTADQLQEAITSFGGSKSRYAGLGASVAGLWQGFYPQVAKGDTKLCFDVLSAIADGCERAAKGFSSPI